MEELYLEKPIVNFMWILNELFWNMWRAMKWRREEGSLSFLVSVCSDRPVVGVAKGCYGLNMQSWCHSPTWVALDSEFYDKLFPSLGVFGATHTVRLLSFQKNSNVSFCSSLSVPQDRGRTPHLSWEVDTTPVICWELNFWAGLVSDNAVLPSVISSLPVSPWPSWGSQPQPCSSISTLSN